MLDSRVRRAARSLGPRAKIVTCALLTAFATAPAVAQCSGADDSLEPNDTCGQALALSLPFDQTGLRVHRHDPDYYRVVVPPWKDIVIEADFVDDDGDVDLKLYDPGAGCGDLWSNLRQSKSNNDDERIVFYNESGSPRELILQVLMWRGSIPECNEYALNIEARIHDPECSPLLHDDGLEDNDTCATARALPVGHTVGLWVNKSDEDFYAARVQPGATLDVTVLFEDSRSDIDLFLYDAAGPCGGGFESGEIARSFSQTDDEQIVWTNTGSSPRDVIVHVDVFQWHSCNDYDMHVVLDGHTAVGSTFCAGGVNSNGERALLAGEGSLRAADQDLVVTATGLPPHTSAYFLCARERALVPGAGGAQGSLCLGGSVGRFDRIVLQSGAQGMVQMRMPLQSMPLGGGLVPVAANESWYFQAWYRDHTGSTPVSNFTSGLAVGFE